MAAKKAPKKAQSPSKKTSKKKASKKIPQAAARKALERAGKKILGRNSKKQVDPRLLKDLEGPEVRDGLLYFSKSDLLRYELAQYKLSNATREQELNKAAIADYKRMAEERMVQLVARGKELAQASTAAGHILNDLQKEVEAVYKVPIADLLYDDETGKISTKDSPVSSSD